MPQKVLNTKGIFQSSRKRKLPAILEENVNEEYNDRSIKKKKSTYFLRSKKKSPGSSRIDSRVHSAKQTVSAAAFFIHSINDNGETGAKRSIDMPEPLNFTSVSPNPNVPILPYQTNLSTTLDENVNIEYNDRSIKKKKSICVLWAGNKETKSSGSSRIVLPDHSAKHTASAAPSPTHSINDNGETGAKRSIDKSQPLNISSILHNSNLSIPTRIQTRSQVKKLHNVYAPEDSVKNILADKIGVKETCNFQEEMRCIICMDTKICHYYKSLECGHNFHLICLRTWFKYSDACPICMPYSSERNTSVLIDLDVSKTHEDVPCSICLDTVESSNFEILSCSHSFHVVCIRTWFGVNEVCPVCMGSNLSIFLQDDFYDLHENMQCMICMNTKVFTDFEFLSCDHSFHAVCLESWFQEHTTCPICVPYECGSSTSNELDEEDPNAEQCVICMGTEQSFDFQNLLCGHSFHATCIQTWFLFKRSCPICTPYVSLSGNSNLFTVDDFVYKCMICRDAKESPEFDVVICDVGDNVWHSFHSNCIETWFQDNVSCPICIPDIALNSVRNSPEEQVSEVVQCAICVDTEEYSEIEFLACCHSFHLICIQNWLKRKKKCPICNTIIFVNGASGEDKEEKMPCA